MGETLRKRLAQSRFESPVHEALLDLLVAAGFVRERLTRALEDHELSHAQYNVLRILRGAHPEGYPRCEIGRRMLERAPDVTRLIDRLERRGLVERERSDRDRRLSVTRITRKGLDLVERLKPGIDEASRVFGERLSARDARELSRLCESLYGGNGGEEERA